VDERYQQRRTEFEAYFSGLRLKEGSARTVRSPCGDFSLETSSYIGAPDTWAYSRGLVRSTTDGILLADVRRNAPSFWHTWITHRNGYRYILCGEDYQGYTLVNLNTGKTLTHFPESGYGGYGFCWTSAYLSPDSQVLAVDGCYWACPYEIVLFDFRHPEVLPYPELARMGEVVGEPPGWLDNETFAFHREATFRKSDGSPHESLPPEEQARLDDGGEPVEYREQTVYLKRPPCKPLPDTGCT
jgi:hypothetical protein